ALEGLKIANVYFDWEGDGQRLRVSGLSAALYGGRLSGAVEVPLRSGRPGSVTLRFEGLDLSVLGRDVPGLPFDLGGRADGALAGTLGGAGVGRPPGFAAKIAVRSPRLRVQGLPTEDFRGTITYRRPAVDYLCEGQTLGGHFLLQGRLPSRATGGPAPEG